MKNLEELYSPIAGEMTLVRRSADELWTETLELLEGRGAARAALGGKMLRPALSLLSAGAAGARQLERFVLLSTAMEALHVAALVHDDVVDRAQLRRGGASLNATWDNHIAVLGGDYLVSRALERMAEYGSCDVLRLAVATIRLMAEGELQNFCDADSVSPEERCLRTAEKKTASLFELTCCSPALLLGAPQCTQPLRDFAQGFGIAFQLVDDVLDLSQEEDTLGKPSCGDLVEGKETMPIILLRRGLSEADNARLDSFRGELLTAEDRRWVAEALAGTGARQQVETMARNYSRGAKEALSALPESDYRASMTALCDFILLRDS